MHVLKNMIKREIDEIECSGISKSNVALLGELVDMYKDIENIEYWKFKMGYADGDDKHHESMSDKHSHSDMIMSLKNLNERLKNTDSLKDKNDFTEVASELMVMAEDIYLAMKGVTLDEKMAVRFRSMFK